MEDKMCTDVLTRLQAEYNQLLIQIFSVFSYLNQRHPSVAPQAIPGLRFTRQNDVPNPGPEDTDPEKVAYPLEPVDPDTFAAAQEELAEDLILKAQQIQQLIMKLPGIDQDEKQQAGDIQRLAAQVDELDKARMAKRKEMRQLVRRLDAVVAGMSSSIDYSSG